jgi:hypothetical protein
LIVRLEPKIVASAPGVTRGEKLAASVTALIRACAFRNDAVRKIPARTLILMS